MTTHETRYPKNFSVLRVEPKPGLPYLQAIHSGTSGISINSYLGGANPNDMGESVGGRVKSMGVHISKDEARELIAWLSRYVDDKDEPALCFRGYDAGAAVVKQVVSACDQSEPKASEVLLDAARKVGQRVVKGEGRGGDGALALALTQAANAARDLEVQQ